MTVEQLREFKEAFNMFDKNGDGSISRDEIREALKTTGRTPCDTEIDDMLHEVDLNKDGKIDFHEFAIMMEKRVAEEQRTIMSNLFKAIDEDNSGTLTADELKNALQEMGHLATEKDVNKMMELADLNHDGLIDIEEFIKVMAKI